MTIGERIRELSSEIIEMDARWKVLWDLQNHGDNSNGTEREIGDIEYQFRAKCVELAELVADCIKRQDASRL